MSRILRASRTAFAAAWLLAAGLAGAAAAAPAPEAVTASSSQRFVAHGPGAVRNVPLLRWAEDIAARLEKALGEPLPHRPDNPVRFFLSEDPAHPAAGLRREQSVGEFGVGQRLYLVNLDRAEPGDVLEAIVSLLLCRYAVALQAPARARERPAAPPDWFAIGLARNLYPGQRAASQQAALRLWRDGADTSLRRALSLPHWVPGERDEKNLAAALAGWMKARPDFPRLAGRLLRQWADGGTVDEEKLAGLLTATGDVRALHMEWDLWLASLQQLQSPAALTPEMLVRRVRDVLVERPAMLPWELPADLPEAITPAVLIARRNEPWAPQIARRMTMALVAVPTGRLPELVEVVDRYRAALEPLLHPAPKGFWKWIVWRDSPATLQRRLDRADRELRELESMLADLHQAETAPPRPPDAAEARLEDEALLLMLRDEAVHGRQ